MKRPSDRFCDGLTVQKDDTRAVRIGPVRSSARSHFLNSAANGSAVFAGCAVVAALVAVRLFGW